MKMMAAGLLRQEAGNHCGRSMEPVLGSNLRHHALPDATTVKSVPPSRLTAEDGPTR